MAEAAKTLLEKARRFFGAAAEDLTPDAPAQDKRDGERTLKDVIDGRPLPKRQLREEEKRPYSSGGVRG